MGERLLERAPGIDRVEVDRQANVLAGEAGSRSGQAELRAYKVEEIRRSGAIENGEGRVEPDRKGVEPQEAAADRMKCSRPGQDGRLR